jgi:hypothetical protein
MYMPVFDFAVISVWIMDDEAYTIYSGGTILTEDEEERIIFSKHSHLFLRLVKIYFQRKERMYAKL